VHDYTASSKECSVKVKQVVKRVSPARGLLRCQYLYLCTSKASKASAYRPSYGTGVSICTCVLSVLVTSKASEASAYRPSHATGVSICTCVLVKQVNSVLVKQVKRVPTARDMRGAMHLRCQYLYFFLYQ
jgi:hypothetical protein